MFFIALIGTTIAGVWDLITTEVPDEISLLLSSFGIFSWFAYGASTGNFTPLKNSLFFGAIFLLFGWFMYTLGHWGGADTVILGSIFFTIPFLPQASFFPLDYIVNFFLVSAGYMIIYSIILGLKHKKIQKELKKDITKNKKIYYTLSLLIGIDILSALFLPLSVTTLGLLFLFLILFYKYAKVVENKFFTRTIKTKNLKPGDVAFESKQWVGLEEEEVKKLKKKQDRIKIKEGVRLVPAFPLTLLITYLFGNILFIFL